MMARDVVITGIGLVTPLGKRADTVLEAIAAERSAVRPPEHFDASPFDCQVCAVVDGFDAEAHFPGNKTLRLMNRDAQLAAVAARAAVRDAGLEIGRACGADEVGLFGATGLAGLGISEVSRLVRNSVGPRGELDLRRFGREALKRVRPVLSFKILANMPICFVSILEGIRGPNAVYTPWEGQGARAIAAGVRAVASGRVRCALVGGCDAKAHSLGFISLQQHGVFRSWRDDGCGTAPGEGAAFLVIEGAADAVARGARAYARIAGWRTWTRNGEGPAMAFGEALCSRGVEKGDAEKGDRHLRCAAEPVPFFSVPFFNAAPTTVIAGADGGPAERAAELLALDAAGAGGARIVRSKGAVGNLFAAAAGVQVALAAACCRAPADAVWANCFGHGSEIASFALEGV